MSPGPDVVFLGPSLSREVAATLAPDALLLAPARMGDVATCARRLRPRAIGLVDGVFRTAVPVLHKELLFALDLGCWVLGAASMGALRAAECAPFGVIGVGSIYEDYASGRLEDDDEVALVHAGADEGFRALSDAMVTVRAAVDALLDARAVTGEEAAALLGRQKARWFPERSVRGLIADARGLGVVDDRVAAIADVLSGTLRDPKAEDAAALLAALRTLPDGPFPEERRPRTEMTPVFRALLARDVAVAEVEGEVVTPDEIRRQAALWSSTYDEDHAAARLRVAAGSLSRWLGGELSDVERDAARAFVAARLGTDVEGLADVAGILDLDELGLDALVEREGHVLRLSSSWLGTAPHGAVTEAYLDELRLRGGYAGVRDAAALQLRVARAVGGASGTDTSSLLAHLARLSGTEVPQELAELVARRELGTIAELLDALGVALAAHGELFGAAPPATALSSDAALRDEADPPWGSRGR